MFEPELAVARQAARAGTSVVASKLGARVEAEFKGDANPVTAVDRAAEAAILAVIHQAFPSDAVLAEESGGEHVDSDRVWMVDPLDGTVNFIHGIPQVAVSVAFWVDGRPAVGVVVDVSRGEELRASAGGGAFLNDRPIAVSGEPLLAHSLIATGFPYDRNLHGRTYAGNMGEVLVRAQGIRRLGSAALDFAWVACGRYEGYWEFGLKPWDAAAGVLLVSEAGGLVTGHRGDAYRVDSPGVVASNGLIHAELVTAISIAPPEHVT
ncbi:MAG: inositol monophosphatase family protein [Actinomycetota bacterium]